MKCIITGVETDNKWKSLPVSKQAIAAARKVIEEFPNYTMRRALLKVNTALIKELKKAKNV
jgi:hypothetical protein